MSNKINELIIENISEFSSELLEKLKHSEETVGILRKEIDSLHLYIDSLEQSEKHSRESEEKQNISNIKITYLLQNEIDNLRTKLRKDDKFIKHIQSHLKDGEEVICKICGKTAKKILS